jgi:hypothetical protein
MKKVYSELAKIQKTLKTPKDRINDYNAKNKFKYRSCADILEAVKPLLPEGYALTLTDELIWIGDRHYVRASAVFSDGEKSVVVTALAREEFVRTGMDVAQITGAASSYARKYALNGLFCIDDTKDPDAQDNTEMGRNNGVELATPEQIKYLKAFGKEPADVAAYFKEDSLTKESARKALEMIDKATKRAKGGANGKEQKN